MRTGWLSAGKRGTICIPMAFGLEELKSCSTSSERQAMKTGWHKVSDACYYSRSNGAAVKGWQKIGGYRYYFDKMGVVLTNHVLDGRATI